MSLNVNAQNSRKKYQEPWEFVQFLLLNSTVLKMYFSINEFESGRGVRHVVYHEALNFVGESPAVLRAVLSAKV